MKIAILNQPQDPMAAGQEQRGSVAIVNWELARCLARRHEVIVYAPRARGQSGVQRWGGIEIRRIPFVARRLHKVVQLLAGVSGGARHISLPGSITASTSHRLRGTSPLADRTSSICRSRCSSLGSSSAQFPA